jgi:lysyl endopeptidase
VRLLLLLSITPFLFAQETKMEGSIHRAAQKTDRQAPRALRNMGQPSRKVALRALTDAESQPAKRKPGLTAVGVTRQLPADVLSQGEWSSTAEGKRVWRVSLESTGAESLRVKFTNFNVEAGTVWLLNGDTNAAGPYTGKGPQGDGEFWSDIVAGDSLIIAYEPADPVATIVPFGLAQVSHRFGTATKAAASVKLAAAATCALDVACYPDYSGPASAVALMYFESDGGSYQCTGSLVSSGATPAVPLFLTANHCISTPEEAKSLITIFNYQTPSCNGTAPAVSTLPRVNSATVLATQPMALGDFTLLQLTGFPNVDVKVLGWYSAEISTSEKVTSISHPRGDYKRIALGQRSRDVAISFADGDRMPANKGLQVDWLEGVTQGGSSGSPLLANINGTQYVVGTLSAGPDINENSNRQVCSARNAIASYGRFSAAFPYLEPLLKGTSTAVTTNVFTATRQSSNRALLSWNAIKSQVQIRVLSPTGPPMTGIEAASGTAVSGDWVTEGMLFYLQDATDGDSSGAAKTLAVLTAHVTQ